MTLNLRRYIGGDEFTVAARDDFDDAFTKAGSRLPEGPAWTLHEDGRAVGVGGVYQLEGRLGEWEAWAYLADMTPRQWLKAALHAIAVLSYVKRAFHVERIFACAGAGPASERLLIRMGFTPTGQVGPFGPEFVMENA